VATGLSAALIAAVLAGLVASALIHDFRVLLSSRVDPQDPISIYPHLPVPGTSRVANAPGAAGADYVQVYWAGLALRHGESAYNPKTAAFRDIYGPQRGYPPLTNWLYLPLTYLRYADAVLVHTLLTLAALLGVSAFLLWRMQLRRQIAPVVLAQVCLLLLTPIGFTHFERGQFDLWVTVSAALCVACSYWPAPAFGLAIASGSIGALKWTSLSFLGCFAGFGFVLGANRMRWVFLAIPLVAVLITALFYSELGEYWRTIQVYELTAPPVGLTLQYFLPRLPAKAAPIVATLVPIIFACAWKPARAKREIVLRATAVPFSLALMNLTNCFGSLGYEYHTVTTLGMLPGLVVWLEREPLVSLRLKQLTASLYALFLIIAFRVFERAGSLESKQMSAVYVIATLVLLAISVRVIRDVGVLDATRDQAGDLLSSRL
jgi:hypothetical protein